MEKCARSIVEQLQSAGFVAYYAGGCVRDELRGVTPSDYDIATDATPEVIRQIFPRTLGVGAHFGVIIVLEQGMEFQVATFRADGEYRDGRHPQMVHFTSAEKDAKRRDFTINGIFKNPVTNEIIDYVGGRKDIDARILRAIGNPRERFKEDRLRILRAIRFSTTLGYKIEKDTWNAIREYAPEIVEVSAERIREELVRLLVHPSRAYGLDLLDASGLLEVILPEVAALKGCEQPPQFHPEGDVFIHTRIMLELLKENPSPALAFAVLLHDIGKPPTFTVDATERIRFNGHDRLGASMAEKVMHRLKFSRIETHAVVEMIANHMVFKDVQNMRPAKLRRFMARPTFDEELELHRVDCASSHNMLDNYIFLQNKEEEFANEPLVPPSFLTGRDLLERGWKQGASIGQILEEAQTLQLEGKFSNRESALQWLDTQKTI